ncbi:Putative 60S ribosomal protein L37a [Lemmus lemmus]
MAKHVKKVGIVGKYETHYGASVQKMKKIEVSQHKISSLVPSVARPRRRDK